jgi:uncharacterized membrane protein
MTDKEVEAMIKASGAEAPRVTPEHINSIIVDAAYYVFPDTTLTICALTLKNGFVVTGESAAASPANFNEEIGKTIAYANAHQKIWALEGYLLRQKLYEGNP